MDDSRFLECLSADYGDLRDAVTAVELPAPVGARLPTSSTRTSTTRQLT
jgi:hypothetical protein